MSEPRSRVLSLWFPLALLALLIALPGVHRVGAAASSSQLIVADLRADELLLIDTDSALVTARFALPGGAHELLELPDGRIVASIEQAGLLAVVDLDTAEVTPIPIGGTPHGLALAGDVVLVTDRAVSQIRRFEVDGWSELDPIDTGRWPHAIALTEAGELAVAHALDNAISLGADQFEVSELPETIAVASDGTIATAGAVGGLLHLLDSEGNEVLRVILGGRPVRVLFSPNGAEIAAGREASGEVALIDRSGTVRRTAVPGVPDGLAFSSSGDRLYVSDVVGGGVAVLDTDDLALLEVIEAGTATGAILVR